MSGKNFLEKNFFEKKFFIGGQIFCWKKFLSGKKNSLKKKKKNSQIRDRNFRKVMKLTKIWPIM